MCTLWGRNPALWKCLWWYSKFSEGCKQVLNLPHVYIWPTSVGDVNTHHVKELILGNRWIPVYNIASHCSINVESVETFIHERVLFKQVCAQWIWKMLMLYLKVKHVAISAKYMRWFELEGKPIPRVKSDLWWDMGEAFSCFGIQKKWFMLIFLCVMLQLLALQRCAPSDSEGKSWTTIKILLYCMRKLVHMQHIWQRYWQKLGGKSWTTLLIALT